MGLAEILEQHKGAIVNKWFQTVIETYPQDTARFLKNRKDPFANPVGSTTLRGLQGLFDSLFTDLNREQIIGYLDPIIRIRAVQDFTPSQALAFIFELKTILRKRINQALDDKNARRACDQLESRIDIIGLIAFDIYMQCRETIFSLRTNDEHRKTLQTFKRAKLIVEDSDVQPNLKSVT